MGKVITAKEGYKQIEGFQTRLTQWHEFTKYKYPNVGEYDIKISSQLADNFENENDGCVDCVFIGITTGHEKRSLKFIRHLIKYIRSAGNAALPDEVKYLCFEIHNGLEDLYELGYNKRF